MAMLGLKNDRSPSVDEVQKPAISLPELARKRTWLYALDILVLVIIGILLYYGYSSWRFNDTHTDVARYECYAESFLRGTPALHAFPPNQCSFITTNKQPSIVQRLKLHGSLANLINEVEAQQSPARPLHSLPPEYPLLTLIPFSLALAAHARWYRVTFAILMALVAAILYFILLRYRSRGAALAFACYLVVGSWATALGRFDLIPAALTLIALLFAQRNRWNWAFAMLALATLFKLYPLVLLIPFLIAQQKRSSGEKWYAWHRWSPLVTFAALCILVTAISLALSIEGTLAPLSYFDYRPVQIESFSASLLWLASFFGHRVHYVTGYGAVNVFSNLTPQVDALDMWCLGLGLLYTFWLQWWGKLDLFTTSLLTLLIVIITGKVFSPQYLIWVTPIIAYIGKTSWKWLLSWGAIGLLTTIIYPYMYKIPVKVVAVPLLPAYQPVLLARNALLLALVLVLLYQATRIHSNEKVWNVTHLTFNDTSSTYI